MDIKKATVGLLLIAAVWFAGYRSSWANAEPAGAQSKFGVLSVRRIFQECKRNEAYRAEATAEQDKLIAELDKLQKEIELAQAGLKTLKAGTAEHLNLMKETLEKQANLQAQQEFAKQQLSLKDQRWTEALYKDILAMTGEIAAAKGLDFVLESDDIELPAASANDLMLTIRTHKLLYSGGCADITAEVMAKVDSMAVIK